MSDVLIAREERVLRITLNREDKRNALSATMCSDIVNAVDAAQSDSGVGAILLDARGAVFCAGMDLAEAATPDAANMTAIHERLFTLAMRSVVPVVVCVQGPALGGGIGLIANGHVVVAAQGSTFALTEIRIGMWPYVIFRSISVAMGERRAVALSLTGRVFSAQEALQFGLIHEVAPAIEAEDRAAAIARHLCDLSPEVIRRGLAFVRETRGMNDAQAVATAARMRAENFASPDFAEGVQAFHQKRKPRWPSTNL